MRSAVYRVRAAGEEIPGGAKNDRRDLDHSVARTLVCCAAVHRSWIVVGLCGLSACSVPLGATPDAGACAASPRYFVTDVWPRYLDHNGCGQSSCHAVSNGHGYYRLEPGIDPPAPTTTLDAWPEAWRDNYYASIQLLRCDAPLESRLLTTPAELADPHPAGLSVDNLAEAKQLFQAWVNAP
jgi:hypothetical protein